MSVEVGRIDEFILVGARKYYSENMLVVITVGSI